VVKILTDEEVAAYWGVRKWWLRCLTIALRLWKNMVAVLEAMKVSRLAVNVILRASRQRSLWRGVDFRRGDTAE